MSTYARLGGDFLNVLNRVGFLGLAEDAQDRLLLLVARETALLALDKHKNEGSEGFKGGQCKEGTLKSGSKI